MPVLTKQQQQQQQQQQEQEQQEQPLPAQQKAQQKALQAAQQLAHPAPPPPPPAAVAAAARRTPAAAMARMHRAPPTRLRSSSSEPARPPMQGLGVRLGTPNPWLGRLERTLEGAAQACSAGGGAPVRAPPKPVARGALYARTISLHLAHGALGRVIVQRERYVDWAASLLVGVLPQLLKPVELRRRHAAGEATPDEQAELERIEAAEAAAGGEAAARTLAARREELQQVRVARRRARHPMGLAGLPYCPGRPD